MRRTLMVVLAAIVALALCGSAIAAPAAKAAAKPVAKLVAKPAAKPVVPAAKPAAPTAPAKFDQKKVLEDMWKAPDTTVVGTVNGVKVTKGELLKNMWFWNAPSVLQDILNQKMIEQAAAKANVKLSPSEFQEKINESLKRMGMSDVESLLSQFRVTWHRYMSGTRISALAEKTVQKQVKVTDAEYAEWIKASHILVRFPQEEKDKAKQEEIAKKKADEIYAKVKAGEDFAKLANEFSEDPGNTDPQTNNKKGGDLGWFSRGRMVQEFEKAAFDMKAGEISEPVKTFYGFHIIKVEKLGKDATPAEKVELNKQILERKIPGEMGRWFQDQQAKAKIDNKLMPPPPKEPTPTVRPQPAPKPATPPAPKPGTSTTQPSAPPPPPPPAEKPAAPPAGEKPEAPPPPPPPAPAN
jgi:foldase protein PrsA